jgi:hypothetical protein
VALKTLFGFAVPMSVRDQYGDPLAAIYQGAAVFEKFGSLQNPVSINVQVGDDGMYGDFVGDYVDKDRPRNAIRYSPDHVDWENPAAEKGKPRRREQTVPNFLIYIGGHELSPITRKLTITPVPGDDTKADLELVDKPGMGM